MISADQLTTQLRQRAQKNTPFCFSRMRCFDFNLIRPGDMEYRIVDAQATTDNVLILVFEAGPGGRHELRLTAPSGLILTHNALIAEQTQRLQFGTIELWSEQHRYHYRDGQTQTLLDASTAPVLTLSD